ncbi:helix-turn-helix transcriptional regulator [Kitasatospora sp. NPDC096147]|uniref:helix-turn-helix transcriptional regulator n=1 Tax=Kitasatospora sp. NPDC096147 TaxID=3364093 RepID=UPI0037FB18EC
MTTTATARTELAAFLRSRRERIAPEQVGLPAVGRRRTPGLRREEVAQLSAVGVTWYTWLEQARPIQVSGQVLDALARALMLDRSERAHLFALAGSEDPVAQPVCHTVTPAVQLLLDRVDPYPAAVVNSRYDVLAHNRAYTWLAGDLEALPFEERNLMWLAFTDSVFGSRLVDRRTDCAAMVARFRAAMADHTAEPAWKALLHRLRTASPEFEELWQRHEVSAPGNGEKRFVVPEEGLLSFTYTSLWLGPRPSTRLVTYTPLDGETAASLERLAAGRGEGSAGRPM